MSPDPTIPPRRVAPGAASPDFYGGARERPDADEDTVPPIDLPPHPGERVARTAPGNAAATTVTRAAVSRRSVREWEAEREAWTQPANPPRRKTRPRRSGTRRVSRPQLAHFPWRSVALVLFVLAVAGGGWYAATRLDRQADRNEARIQTVDEQVAGASTLAEATPSGATDAPATTPEVGTPLEIASLPPAGLPDDDPARTVALEPATIAPIPVAPRGDIVYAVHVASYRNPEGATREIAGLRARGFEARTVRTDLGSKGIWYRLYVGRFASAAEAQRAREQILALPGYDFVAVRPLQEL